MCLLWMTFKKWCLRCIPKFPSKIFSKHHDTYIENMLLFGQIMQFLWGKKTALLAAGRRAAMSLRHVHPACGGTALQVYEAPPPLGSVKKIMARESCPAVQIFEDFCLSTRPATLEPRFLKVVFLFAVFLAQLHRFKKWVPTQLWWARTRMYKPIG